MIILKILLIIYLCSVACSWAGVYLSSRDAVKQLRKEGYSFIGEPFTFISTISMCGVFLIPVLNTLMALNTLFNYDYLVNETVRRTKEEKQIKMSEFDTLKNMLDRNSAKYVEEVEKEFIEELEKEITTTFLCIPALQDEFLILGFDEDGDLVYVDAGGDWDDYLERIKAREE